MTKENLLKNKDLKISKIENKKYISYLNDKKYKTDINNKDNNYKRIILNISVINIIINIMLAILKLMAGIVGNSYALVTDAIHSASDIIINIIVIIGVKLSSKKADEKYQYGYDRFECVAVIVLSYILFTIGILIGYKNMLSLISENYKSFDLPNILALIISIASLIVKLIMFIVNFSISKKLNSTILRADAWHYFSDVLSGLGIFIGVLGSMMGLEITDIIASLIVSLFIVKVSIELFIDSIRKMIDRSAPRVIKLKIEEIVKNFEIVSCVNFVKTRCFGNFIYADIEIKIKNNLEYHEIVEYIRRIKFIIKSNIKLVKDCNIIIV